jgi:hypothetical protein
MVEAGVWSSHSWEAHILKKLEYTSGKSADGIMTATNAMIEKCRERGFTGRLLRVPSCVNTRHFDYDPQARQTIRKKLGLSDDRIVITYLGKFGGMYQEEEFFRMMRIFLNESNRFFFFIFTIDDHEQVRSSLKAHNIPEDKVLLTSLERNEVPAYLSASDIGHVCHRQSPAKRYCSPIKDGEYWSCGLPLLTFEGISDDYVLARQENIGIVLPDTSDESFRIATGELITFTDETEKQVMADRCRSFVLRDRSVENYQHLYAEVFNEL